MEETFLEFLPGAAAGAAGSVVALFYEEHISLKRAVMMVFVGMALSVFLAPAVVHYVGASEKVSMAINFLMARYADSIMVSGKKVVGKVIEKVVNKYVS